MSLELQMEQCKLKNHKFKTTKLMVSDPEWLIDDFLIYFEVKVTFCLNCQRIYMMNVFEPFRFPGERLIKEYNIEHPQSTDNDFENWAKEVVENHPVKEEDIEEILKQKHPDFMKKLSQNVFDAVKTKFFN